MILIVEQDGALAVDLLERQSIRPSDVAGAALLQQGRQGAGRVPGLGSRRGALRIRDGLALPQPVAIIDVAALTCARGVRYQRRDLPVGLIVAVARAVTALRAVPVRVARQGRVLCRRCALPFCRLHAGHLTTAVLAHGVF